MSGTWRRVRAPDGRHYTMWAHPIGVPDAPRRSTVWLLGLLWHHTVAQGAWKVDVTEDVSMRQALRQRQWRPPRWSTANLASEQAALLELARLAGLIESGAWPRR